MAKVKAQFKCTACGNIHPKWAGQCAGCGAWNCLEEFVSTAAAPKASVARHGYGGSTSGSVLAPLARAKGQTVTRYPSGLGEFDRALGGGVVVGGTLLIGGNPGAGKSTLLLQSGVHCAENGKKIVYAAGEETLEQIRDRANRLELSAENILAIEETNVVALGHVMENDKPDMMIVDSIQTCYHPDVDSSPGSVSQLTNCTAYLNRLAKVNGVGLFIVGHINKAEELAGPNAIKHIVDTVMMLSSSEDARYRLLKVQKNRFGPDDEIGIFEMTSKGMIEVDNPSAIFLSRVNENATGSIVTALWEGTRPILVEVQGLLDESVLSNPRRVAVGMDNNRLGMLLAVVNKHTGLVLGTHDVYANIVGGLKVVETSIDLPVVLSMVSSFRDAAIPSDVITFGEIGLSGEVRPVMSALERLKEAHKLGFKRAIVPASNFPKGLPKDELKGMELMPVATLRHAVDCMLDCGSLQQQEAA